MLEPSAKRILTHALQAVLPGWALALALIAQAGAAESLPASVRACTAETDRERRLDCFDREVARFPASKSTPRTGTTQPGAPSTPTLPAGSAAAAPAAQTAARAPAANTPATSASSGTAEESVAHKTDNSGKPGRIAARLVSIDHAPNEMVLHLDNGEVWEEVQSVAGDLSLKVGDNITIDKRLGSYWLTGPHVSGMKVRQKS